MKGEQKMIRVRILRESGSEVDWEISTMESLAKFQGYLTEEVVKNIQTELSDEQKKAIVRDYLNDVEHDYCDGIRYDFLEELENNMPHTYDDLIERALRDTDYDNIDEITEELDRRANALYDVYEIVREYS